MWKKFGNIGKSGARGSRERGSSAAGLSSLAGGGNSLGGTVASGCIEKGTIKVGHKVEIMGLGSLLTPNVTGVEMFNKQLDDGQASDMVGLLVRPLKREDIRRRMVIAKPGACTSSTKFKAEIYVLFEIEGGRDTPFFSNFSPQLYMRTTDVTGRIKLRKKVKMVVPREIVIATCELILPLPLERGLRFA